jgi:hypothetical protein
MFVLCMKGTLMNLKNVNSVHVSREMITHRIDSVVSVWLHWVSKRLSLLPRHLLFLDAAGLGFHINSLFSSPTFPSSLLSHSLSHSSQHVYSIRCFPILKLCLTLATK